MSAIIKLIKDFLKFLFPGLFEEKEEYIKEYQSKDFMTQNELIFYNKLIELEKRGYKIVPQVNLASIIHKKSNSKYQTELFRNVDFAIFKNDFSSPLLLIELNDITHDMKQRKKRDLKVKDICNQANIKLMTFYTKYENKKDYVIDRILKEIEKED